MDAQTAKSLMDEVLEIDKRMARLAHSIDALAEPERTAFKRALGFAMYAVCERLIKPISKAYPDLDPLKKPENS